MHLFHEASAQINFLSTPKKSFFGNLYQNPNDKFLVVVNLQIMYTEHQAA
jgi:hypothetical protein